MLWIVRNNMGNFNCAPIESFNLSRGKRIIVKRDNGELKRGTRGIIVDLIATRTYGINLDDGRYWTLWDEDIMPEMSPEDAYYYGQDCYKGYVKREAELSFFKKLGFKMLGLEYI